MDKKARVSLMLLGALTFARESVAQVMPSTPQIERECQRIEHDRKQMFSPNNSITQNAIQSFPNIQTPPSSGMDVEALASQYKRKVAMQETDNLMIFASFTMPAESLQRLISQTNRVGASVMLMGFKNNSLKETVRAIQSLGGQGGHIQVNPNAFAKYKIKIVPTMVLVQAETMDPIDIPIRFQDAGKASAPLIRGAPNGNGEIGEQRSQADHAVQNRILKDDGYNEGHALHNNYVAVSGDVSLDYALEEIVRHAPQFELLASRYLRQLRGNQ